MTEWFLDLVEMLIHCVTITLGLAALYLWLFGGVENPGVFLIYGFCMIWSGFISAMVVRGRIRSRT